MTLSISVTQTDIEVVTDLQHKTLFSNQVIDASVVCKVITTNMVGSGFRLTLRTIHLIRMLISSEKLDAEDETWDNSFKKKPYFNSLVPRRWRRCKNSEAHLLLVDLVNNKKYWLLDWFRYLVHLWLCSSCTFYKTIKIKIKTLWVRVKTSGSYHIWVNPRFLVRFVLLDL